MLEIKTNQLKTRKRVLIDDHEYIVRHMGNIEQLELSQLMRSLEKLAIAEKQQPLTEVQVAEIDTITSKITDIFIGLFDDGGDQSKSRKLLASLSEGEIATMLDQIFEGENGTPNVS